MNKRRTKSLQNPASYFAPKKIGNVEHIEETNLNWKVDEENGGFPTDMKSDRLETSWLRIALHIPQMSHKMIIPPPFLIFWNQKP